MNGLKMNVAKTRLMVLTRKGKYQQMMLKFKLEIPVWRSRTVSTIWE